MAYPHEFHRLAGLADICLLEAVPGNWHIPLQDGDPLLLAPLQVATFTSQPCPLGVVTQYVWIGTSLGGTCAIRLQTDCKTGEARYDTEMSERLRKIILGPLNLDSSIRNVISIISAFATMHTDDHIYGGHRYLAGDSPTPAYRRRDFEPENWGLTEQINHTRFDLQDQLYNPPSKDSYKEPSGYLRPDNLWHVHKWAIVLRLRDRLQRVGSSILNLLP
jgi:hypothetical protein